MMTESKSILLNFLNGNLSKDEFLNILYHNENLQDELEKETKIGTHTGHGNLLLYLLDTEEEIFYEKETKPVIKAYLVKCGVEINSKMKTGRKHVMDVWVSEYVSYESFSQALELNTRGSCLFQKYFKLKHAFCDWDHAIIEYFGEIPCPIADIKGLDGFGDLWEKVQFTLKEKNIQKLSCLIALDELDMSVEVKESHSFLYIGKIEVEDTI
ncbi:hypothetical protein ACFCP7_08965 [Paenibacillus elgii]